jgi:hypothetical protein
MNDFCIGVLIQIEFIARLGEPSLRARIDVLLIVNDYIVTWKHAINPPNGASTTPVFALNPSNFKTRRT